MPSNAGVQALRLAHELAAEEEARFGRRSSAGPGTHVGRGSSASSPSSPQSRAAEAGRRSRPAAPGRTGSALAATVATVSATSSSRPGRISASGRASAAETGAASAGSQRSTPATPTSNRSAATRITTSSGTVVAGSGAVTRPTVAAGRGILRQRPPASRSSPPRGMTPTDDQAFPRELARGSTPPVDDEALARQLAQEEEVGVWDRDEEMALALAREFEQAEAQTAHALARDSEQRSARAQMETAIAWAASAQDFGGLAAVAASAAAAGIPPEALLGLPGLGGLLMMEHGFTMPRPEATGEQQSAAPSEGQLRRLPTRKATAQLLEEECPVCFANYEEGEEVRTLPCLHTFHTECIDQWLTSRRATALCCPVCHTKVEL